MISPQILQWLQVEAAKSDQTTNVARLQALRREKSEMERLQRKLDLMYEDRLDGRISPSMYDRLASETCKQLETARQEEKLAEDGERVAVQTAVEWMAEISEAARQFSDESASGQNSFLRLVVGRASWQGGELRMSLKKPFEILRLSNSASVGDLRRLEETGPSFDNWRRGGDSNPRYP